MEGSNSFKFYDSYYKIFIKHIKNKNKKHAFFLFMAICLWRNLKRNGRRNLWPPKTSSKLYIHNMFSYVFSENSFSKAVQEAYRFERFSKFSLFPFCFQKHKTGLMLQCILHRRYEKVHKTKFKRTAKTQTLLKFSSAITFLLFLALFFGRSGQIEKLFYYVKWKIGPHIHTKFKHQALLVDKPFLE